MTIKVLFNSLKNQVYHERIKHIDMKLHFIIDEVEKRSVVVKKAKVIPIAKFKFYMNLISFLEVALVDKLCARRFFFYAASMVNNQAECNQGKVFGPKCI